MLTNHLYPHDLVISSLIETLDRTYSLHENLYWLWELVYTLDTIEDGLLCIVALFYPHAPEPLIRLVKNKSKEALRLKDLKKKAIILSSIIANLRRIPKSTDALVIQQAASDMGSRPTSIYVDKNGRCSTRSCFESAISSGNNVNVGFYLTKMINQCIDFDNKEVLSSMWEGKRDTVDLIAISGDLGRRTCKTKVNGSKVFVVPSSDVIKSLEKTFSIVDDPDIDAHTKLRQTRLYKVKVNKYVSTLITSDKTILDATRHNWLSMAMPGVSWEHRLNSHNAEITDGDLNFSNDDDEEEFMELYSLDFDELPLDVQCLSIPQS